MPAKKQKTNNALVPRGNGKPTLPAEQYPALIAAAGAAAQFAWEEFIFARIRNPNTRKAYQRGISQFLAWCQEIELPLQRITPSDVGRYFDQHQGSPKYKNLHLAAIRHLFDRLVLRHVVVLNPADSVRGERDEIVEGKTPELAVDQYSKLLHSVSTDNVVGLRDRAIIATLIYTAARVGAVAKLTRASFRNEGDQWVLRFREKGGKQRIIPVRHNLEGFLTEYLDAAGLTDAGGGTPLFRGTVRREKRLTGQGMSPNAICRMFKRRLRDAELPEHYSPHGARSTTATDLLNQGVALDDVQYLLGHADPRTTRFYDRRKKKVTRNIVERISVE